MTYLRSIGLSFIAVCLMSAFAAADDATTTQADKSQFTLFNPTPADLLRGMDTDRPNTTNTPHTIDAGHVQIETGVIDYGYFRDRSGGNDVREDDFDLGQFNVRFGVLNNVEMNVAFDAFDDVQARDYAAGASQRASSFGDTVVGGKWNLWGAEGSDDTWATALAIQPQFKFPTARDDVGNGRFECSVVAPFLMNLPEALHLSLQTGISDERSSGNSGYVTGFPSAVSIDREFGPLDLYVEYACDPTTENHVKIPQTIDLGGVLQLTNNLMIDAGVNLGLNNTVDNVEVVAGVSVRF